jgi:hypothetical protein
VQAACAIDLPVRSLLQQFLYSYDRMPLLLLRRHPFQGPREVHIGIQLANASSKCTFPTSHLPPLQSLSQHSTLFFHLSVRSADFMIALVKIFVGPSYQGVLEETL